jgi:hypothetical protein
MVFLLNHTSRRRRARETAAASGAVQPYKTLAADLEKELAEKGAVYPLKVVWGRKPE